MNDAARENILIARIGKPHGLRGEVTVQVHTDAPGKRFATGAQLQTEPAERGPLTVRAARLHNGIQLLAFEEAPDRTAAEALRGIRLVAPAEATADEDDPEDDGFYEDDLVGLAAVDPAGAALGTVTALILRPVQDLLEVEVPSGETVLVPFVEQIVPEVDLDAGKVIIDAPAGLFELPGTSDA